MHKPVTSNKAQQSEREKERNRKHPQVTVISVNEFWHHTLKYTKIITNLDSLMIQITLLESRTVKSLQKNDSYTNNNFTQPDANVTNNSKKLSGSQIN